MPSITVVTLAMELDEGLRITLESVKQQNLNLRHIVIDGSNTSDIKNYVTENYKRVELFKQRPQGIYHAMNFALSKIQLNDWVLFLNSSDFLGSHKTLSKAHLILESSNHWCFWQTIGFTHGGEVNFLTGQKIFEGKEFSKGKILMPHPSTLIPCKWILAAGGFNEKYKIIADMDLAFRIFKKHGDPIFIDNAVSIHQLGGISSSSSQESALELRKSRFQNFTIRTILEMTKKIFWAGYIANSHVHSADVEKSLESVHYDSCTGNQRYPLCCRSGLLLSSE
jgi:glycosyltransferase involved in cell wall biosynthesis